MKTSPCYRCKDKHFLCHCDCKKYDDWVCDEWKRKTAIKDEKQSEILKYLHDRRATQ